MGFKLWGDTREIAEMNKKNLERQLERLLLERGSVNFDDLYEEFWHEHHLLSHYLQIFLKIKELEEEGKVIVDENKNISMAKVAFLDANGLREVTIWDLEHKKEDIDEKKKIIERYQRINYLA
jgi:hypothetical protein